MSGIAQGAREGGVACHLDQQERSCTLTVKISPVGRDDKRFREGTTPVGRNDKKNLNLMTLPER